MELPTCDWLTQFDRMATAVKYMLFIIKVNSLSAVEMHEVVESSVSIYSIFSISRFNSKSFLFFFLFKIKYLQFQMDNLCLCISDGSKNKFESPFQKE